MIELGNPKLLVLLVEVAAMGYVAFQLARWRGRAQERFAGPRVSRWQRAHGWPGTLLLLGAATLIVFAAARPQWGSRELEREREGVDLVIALDISTSMLAQDASPNRLALAQTELSNLLSSQSRNRVGLVFFAGSAILRSPLTTDTQAIAQLIQRAGREGGLTRSGSDLGGAIDQSLSILAASESTSKALLIVSDGEDHAGTYESRLPVLREQGIAVFTAGAGTTAGATLNEIDPRTGQSRLKLDAAGRPVITSLDERPLLLLAEAGSGRYLHLGSGDSLVSLADDLASLEQTPLGAQVQRVAIERFQLFAGAAFVLLILAWVVPERVRFSIPLRLPRLRPNAGLAVLALLIGACGGNADPLRDDNAAATALFNAGDFAGALAAYEQLLSQRPDVPELSFNTGNTLHRLGEYERALSETQRALPPVNTKLGAHTYYALGNHFLALGELEQAMVAYRSSLLLDPDDKDAKFNYELTLLQAQQQQAQPQPDPAGQPQTQPQPGQGTPTPQAPQGQPQPGATPSAGPGQPQPSTPGTPPPPSAEELRRSLEQALQGIDEELTFEEAIQILDLLRQQQERRPPMGAPGAPSGPDY